MVERGNATQIIQNKRKNEANLSTNKPKKPKIGCEILTYREKSQKTLDFLR